MNLSLPILLAFLPLASGEDQGDAVGASQAEVQSETSATPRPALSLGAGTGYPELVHLDLGVWIGSSFTIDLRGASLPTRYFHGLGGFTVHFGEAAARSHHFLFSGSGGLQKGSELDPGAIVGGGVGYGFLGRSIDLRALLHMYYYVTDDVTALPGHVDKQTFAPGFSVTASFPFWLRRDGIEPWKGRGS